MSGGSSALPIDPRDRRRDFRWVPVAMPEVARLLDEQRTLHGVAFVNRCWQRGVVQGLPGWFFAAEGSVMLGAPTALQMIDWLDPLPVESKPAAVLCLADPDKLAAEVAAAAAAAAQATAQGGAEHAGA